MSLLNWRKNLTYNKRRYDESFGCYISGFEWYLSNNFYTYDRLKETVKEIEEAASLLKSDYNNPRLDDIKKEFSIFYMYSQDDPDYINRDKTALQKHISVVIDFYHRFSKRITEMMENNKNTTIISIMGP